MGRDREIALLRRLLEELPGAPGASVVLIRGAPGMGKSSLLQLTAALARRIGAGILKASAFESERIRPFAVWNDALRRALPDNATSRLLSSGERITRDQAFASLYDQLREHTSRHPVVILFDDVQWCDESSVSALHYVLRMNRRLPFLLVAAARETNCATTGQCCSPSGACAMTTCCRSCAWNRSARADLCTLIQRQNPGVDAARLSRQCAGNPLLALELARAEAEGGSARSLAELVQDRMSRLDPAAVDVLLWSAVLAPQITLDSLVAVSGLDRRRAVERGYRGGGAAGHAAPGPQGLWFLPRPDCPLYL